MNSIRLNRIVLAAVNGKLLILIFPLFLLNAIINEILTETLILRLYMFYILFM